MALTNDTKFANRYGLDLIFYKYDKSASDFKGEEACSVKFANTCSLELSSDIVWATGGVGKSKLIGFNNPVEGTFTLSTQISTMELLALITGEDPKQTNRKKVVFKNDDKAKSNFYVVEGDTVYKDEDGNIYTEKITLCKIAVSKQYSVDYDGDGDPQSIDVVLELASNGDNEVVIIERDEADEG